MNDESPPLPDNPPSAEVCGNQVLTALESIVSIRTRIADDALTADILGTEREGHGVVINDQGLILTIGYVVTEAESVWIVDGDNNAIHGHVVAYDQQSGFGLVQALGKLQLPPVMLGKSESLHTGQSMLLAGHGGLDNAQQVQVIGVDEFAGYWEYLLDAAIFVAPAHPNWSGAALIGEDGMLYGIGSLVLQTVDESDNNGSANLVIPIDLLPPILNDLIHYGKRSAPARPWMGWFPQDTADGIVVAGLSDTGPAVSAGIQTGDVILEINGVPVNNLPELFRAVWRSGDAGVNVTVKVERDGEEELFSIQSVDRNSLLKSARLH